MAVPREERTKEKALELVKAKWENLVSFQGALNYQEWWAKRNGTSVVYNYKTLEELVEAIITWAPTARVEEDFWDFISR